MTSQTILDAQKMQEAMKLKFTYRYGNRLEGDKESVAAHSWSMMLVADYLLEKLSTLAPGKYSLNMQRVYQLISYHDLIEAEFFCHDKGYLFENWTRKYQEEKRLSHFADFPELPIYKRI